MGNSNENEGRRSDKLLKNTTLVFGLLSTLLTIFIAVSNYSINRKISEFQAKNSKLEAEIKNATLLNSNYENESRVIAEIVVFNAREFALNYMEQKISVEWLDMEMRVQFEEYVEKWNNINNLMKRDSEGGLYLRQVVCLQLTNISKTAASNLRLEVMQKNFDNQKGFISELPYYKISTAEPGWEKKQIKLNDLFESNLDVANLRTRTLVPIVHVAGSNWYFGQVNVPVKIKWHDERLNKEKSVNIDVTNDNMIRSKLSSAVLGKIR